MKKVEFGASLPIIQGITHSHPWEGMFWCLPRGRDVESPNPIVKRLVENGGDSDGRRKKLLVDKKSVG